MLFTTKNTNETTDESTREETYTLWSSTRCAYVLAIAIILFTIGIGIASMNIYIAPASKVHIHAGTDYHLAIIDDTQQQVPSTAARTVRFMLIDGGYQEHPVFQESVLRYRIEGIIPATDRYQSAYCMYPKQVLWRFIWGKMQASFNRDTPQKNIAKNIAQNSDYACP